MRNYTLTDHVLGQVDKVLRTLSGSTAVAVRPYPAADISAEEGLTAAEKQQAARLMRINHVGEVCAQALYQGQAITAKNQTVQAKLEQAAAEEQDHLVWCQQRLEELGGRTSYLNPLWYANSLLLGLLAGWLGDAISLGFLAETERQVEQHLTEHLSRLPGSDEKTRKILLQMRLDEQQHAVTAQQAGARELPGLVKIVMRGLAKVMKITAYWL